MKQEGIGTVVGATTSEVLKKLKEEGRESDRRRKAATGRDTVSISAEARERMAADENAQGEDDGSTDDTDSATDTL